MTISTIRRATEYDLNAIERAAERFCRRHNIAQSYDGQEFTVAVEDAVAWADIDEGKQTRLSRLWRQCFCRALGEPYNSRLTIAYGHVGLTIE
jgi:hypothetical protein